MKSSHKVGSSVKSKVDSHKVWLSVGVAVAILLLAVLLLEPLLSKPEVPFGEKKALAGN